MKLTQEQIDIVNSSGDIKINAIAGSGKTTTVIHYAKTRPDNSRILYLAFNKSVKLEAIKKFSDKGLKNVTVETAHSLAYKHVVRQNNYRIRSQGYKTYEVAELLGISGNSEKHTEYIIANHINKFVSYFCNSNKHKVQDLNYLDTITDKKAKSFVTSFYDYIVKQTRIFLHKMNTGEIEITHDFYLKKFQLSNHKLSYDYILFDEGQDASPAMLDVFFAQNSTKVIVGDTHQQIYGWRFAVNSLEKANFQAFKLSTSFRFGQDIANLAKEVLRWKKHIDGEHKLTIKGMGKGEGKSEGTGNSDVKKSKAVIARTNLGLLLKAIEYISEHKDIDSIYFEGNINSYTYADDGASLYDVLNLYNGKRQQIRDKLIGQMKDVGELSEYIDKTDDIQLSMMVEIVKEYGNNIPKIIKRIKEKHIDNDDKDSANLIFSTVHRCKGMEYDSIQIADDFVSEERLVKIKADKNSDEIDHAKLNEEINLLYVAVTRAKNTIYIPEKLLPTYIPGSPQIVITSDTGKGGGNRLINSNPKHGSKANDGRYSIKRTMANYSGAYQPWTEELDEELIDMYLGKEGIKIMAEYFGRTEGAVRSRIKKLDLDD